MSYSCIDIEVPESRNIDVESPTKEETGKRQETSRKRSYKALASSASGVETQLSVENAFNNEDVSSDKIEAHYSRGSECSKSTSDENGTSLSSKRERQLVDNEVQDRKTTSESPERRHSPSSSSKKSHSSSGKKHKKRSRSRERHRERKKSDSKHSKRERESDSSRSSRRSRSRSPIEKKRKRRSSSSERHVRNEAKGSPSRREDSYQAGGSSSSSYDKPSKFKIPKRKRSRERSHEDERDQEISYQPPEKKVSSALLAEFDDIVRTEHHHIIKKSKTTNPGTVPHVEWCYYYLDPRIPGHITGGRAHLHHLCRVCKRTCLHLLGTYGTGSRKCLACAAEERGWSEDEVPSWYFHDTCEHCKNDTKRRGGGGRGGFGGNRYGGYGGRYGGGYGSYGSRYGSSSGYGGDRYRR